MKEIWITIQDYEGNYEVSNLGGVRGVDRIIVMKNNVRRKVKSKTLNHVSDKDGYLLIQLNKNGKGKLCRVHRLVGEGFILNPQNKPEINHKDGNKENNRASNLEWATSSENMLHSFETGLHKPTKYWVGKFGKEHHSSVPVLQYSLTGEFVAEYNGMHEANRQTGISYKYISRCCLGQRKTTGGFIWKLKNN